MPLDKNPVLSHKLLVVSNARVAELADALDSGSSDHYDRTGSSPVAGTNLGSGSWR